jgi:hypothetical protein
MCGSGHPNDCGIAPDACSIVTCDGAQKQCSVVPAGDGASCRDGGTGGAGGAGAGGAGAGGAGAGGAGAGGAGGGGGGSDGTCYANQGTCNPLTNSCSAGETCDLADTMDFQCFPPPNDSSQGGFCDQTAGPFCQHKLACNANVCTPFCCTRPADGSTLEERGIDALTGPGKVVVVAPGNPGANNWSEKLSWGFTLHDNGDLHSDTIDFRMPSGLVTNWPALTPTNLPAANPKG